MGEQIFVLNKRSKTFAELVGYWRRDTDRRAMITAKTFESISSGESRYVFWLQANCEVITLEEAISRHLIIKG